MLASSIHSANLTQVYVFSEGANKSMTSRLVVLGDDPKPRHRPGPLYVREKRDNIFNHCKSLITSSLPKSTILCASRCLPGISPICDIVRATVMKLALLVFRCEWKRLVGLQYGRGGQ